MRKWQRQPKIGKGGTPEIAGGRYYPDGWSGVIGPDGQIIKGTGILSAEFTGKISYQGQDGKQHVGYVAEGRVVEVDGKQVEGVPRPDWMDGWCEG